MNINPELIINVYIAICLYKLVSYTLFSVIGDILLRFFLNSDTVQESKKTFQEKLKEKLKQIDQ